MQVLVGRGAPHLVQQLHLFCRGGWQPPRQLLQQDKVTKDRPLY
jgi:hypothetical protein